MFKKILIANRGEIAVRIIRACREMHISSIALYEAQDSGSLHARLADECVLLPSPDSFTDIDAIVGIAREKGADAIHPGYGFLAEEAAFARACEEADLAFIGPPAAVLERTRNKVEALRLAQGAGFPTVAHSAICFGHEGCLEENDPGGQRFADLHAEAQRIGYPLLVKACLGGRGRGERLVYSEDQLDHAAYRSATEAQAVYGDCRIYLEKALIPSYKVGVQILADHQGNRIHLGERQGVVLQRNQRVIEETPASCLDHEQREAIWITALDLARLFEYQGIGTVEFLVDGDGQFYFSEIKARIQVEHPLTEMVARVDLVQESIRIASAESLRYLQEDIHLQGWALQARIHAMDPVQHGLPDAGRIHQMRLPQGPEVRIDTYIQTGCDIPASYDPLIAKLAVWGPNRTACIDRFDRALEEFQVAGPQTNLPILRTLLLDPTFAPQGPGHGRLAAPSPLDPLPEERLRDLAVAAAILHIRQNRTFQPVIPPRLMSGWHRDSRKL